MIYPENSRIRNFHAAAITPNYTYYYGQGWFV